MSEHLSTNEEPKGYGLCGYCGMSGGPQLAKVCPGTRIPKVCGLRELFGVLPQQYPKEDTACDKF